jgi:hypothetical protein
MKKISERRRFERLYFKAEDNVKCILSLPNNPEKLLIANITDLSEDGIGFVINKTEYVSITAGDHLILNEVKEKIHLAFFRNIEIEIKWVLNHQDLNKVGFGSQIINTSNKLRHNIRYFMAFYVKSYSL